MDFLFNLTSGCAVKNKPDNRNPYNLDLVQTTEAYNLLVASDSNMQMVDADRI
jgi:hypothetical protein